MQILIAPLLFDGQKVVQNTAVAFEETITAVGDPDELTRRYPHADITRLEKNEVLLPGLINPHVHLEFGANTTHLRYGDFMTWLNSVIAHRDTLIDACKAGCYKRQIDAMLQSGVTTFGAVSSYGKELTACKAAPQRVVFFTEAIGSRPDAVDALYADFTHRLQAVQKAASGRLIPAVAIHSPYSVHPVLMKKILQTTQGLPLSAHFLESPAEKAWLSNGTGDFAPFFKNFLNQSKPLQSAEAFLEALDRPALLTHAVQAEETHLRLMRQNGHTVIHCPRSNRLLGCGRLAIERLEETGISWLIGTDGLSSNTSLNLWEEMRSALMLHSALPLAKTAHALLRSATAEAGKALGMRIGQIAPGYAADIITIRLPDTPEERDDLPLQLILHTQTPTRLYIDGERHV
ncbi:MAG: metal-dependent hydrolase [Epsilonproteobacteria bacterium]|nr:metal-dependent hydrolase [Campylobacterota bacterium]